MIRSIGVFTANRAEKGLLEPVYKALEQAGLLPSWQDMGTERDGTAKTPFQWGAAFAEWVVLNATPAPDFYIVPCDRPEMVGVALYLFYNNHPFAQFHAGDTGSGTHDEIGRWIISRCASIHFANSPESAENLIKSGEEEWRVHTVGSTAFDDIEPDFRKCPSGAFDLLLIHPDTYSMEDTYRDSLSALGMLDKPTVMIGSNHDSNWEVVDMNLRNFLDRNRSDNPKYWYYEKGVPRAEFLGLMSHCVRFITNSSSALYELPRFGIGKWVNVGKRNAERAHLKNMNTGQADGSQKSSRTSLLTISFSGRNLRHDRTRCYGNRSGLR